MKTISSNSTQKEEGIYKQLNNVVYTVRGGYSFGLVIFA